MTHPNVAPTEDAAKRAVFVADLRTFADWLTDNPWVPLPSRMYASKQFNFNNDPKSAAPSLAMIREVADRLGAETDESLPDRTRVTVEIGSIEYRLLTWHAAGRPGERDAELERLRARVAELEAATDRSGLGLLGLDDSAKAATCCCDTNPLDCIAHGSSARAALAAGAAVWHVARAADQSPA